MLYVCVGVGHVSLHVFVHWVSSTGTRLGAVSLQVVPVTWNKRSVVGRPCDRVSVFHPCHVIWGHSRVWEVLNRCEGFFPPREQTVSMQAGWRDSQLKGWIDGYSTKNCGRRRERCRKCSVAFFYRGETTPASGCHPPPCLWEFISSKGPKCSIWITSTLLLWGKFFSLVWMIFDTELSCQDNSAISDMLRFTTNWKKHLVKEWNCSSALAMKTRHSV